MAKLKVCRFCGRPAVEFKKMAKEAETMTDNNWQELKLWLSRCKHCGNEFDKLYRATTGRCIVCDEPIAHHRKCDACGTLVGPGHVITDTIDVASSKLCSGCLLIWRGIDLGVIYAMALETYLRYNGEPLAYWLKYKRVDGKVFKRG